MVITTVGGQQAPRPPVNSPCARVAGFTTAPTQLIVRRRHRHHAFLLHPDFTTKPVGGGVVDLIERTHGCAANTAATNTACQPRKGAHDSGEATSDHQERRGLTHEIEPMRERQAADELESVGLVIPSSHRR
jgi:hypothetical protein